MMQQGQALDSTLNAELVVIPARAREYVFTGVGLCVCVCLFVCLWLRYLKKLWTDLHQIVCEGS